ncbi:MAG: DUF4160 domain-containing protein [Beijerinckiaceae bacterium]
MPVLSRFSGITIEIYPSEHPPPHFHARYAEFIAQIDIRNGVILHGTLPLPQLRAVVAWAWPRRDRLMAAWDTIGAGRKPEKING